jgi:hypothetical protein
MNHPNDWTHATVLMYLLIILNTILTEAHWNECTEQAGVAALSCCVPPRQQCCQKQSKLRILIQQALPIQNSSVTCVNELRGIRWTRSTGRQKVLLSEQPLEHCELTRRLSAALRHE